MNLLPETAPAAYRDRILIAGRGGVVPLASHVRSTVQRPARGSLLRGLLGFAIIASGCAAPKPIEPPVVIERENVAPAIFTQAKKLREAGRLLSAEEVGKQLDKQSCPLALPPARTKPLAGRDIWRVAREAHVRVGYFYLCHKCSHWHLNIAGGYAITADGAVATCFHVVAPKEEMKEGYLVATTESGRVLPVTRILAGNKRTDACIVRVESPVPLTPLALNVQVLPGDEVWCYSAPANRPGFFSDGIVNRFYQHWHGARGQDKSPIRINVSTDWAPGSSGAAVLDRCGNAVGHVATVSPRGEQPRSDASTTRPESGGTVIVFHDAVRAADVLALIQR